MTNEFILESVHTWAKEQGLNYEAMILSEPPAFLDLRPTLKPEDLPSDHSGVCLTIREPEPTEEAPASLACWIPVAGKGGSYLLCREGDDEIATLGKDWFHFSGHTLITKKEVKQGGLDALLTNIDTHRLGFLLKYFWAPALEQWLSSKGLKYERAWPGRDGGSIVLVIDSVEANIEEQWALYSYEDPTGFKNPLGSPTIGVASYGHAALFNPVEEWAIIDSSLTIKTQSELFSWLDEHVDFSK